MVPQRLHNLDKDPIEADGDWSEQEEKLIGKLGEVLLKKHNQGYSRNWWGESMDRQKELILDDGWHNLRNDLDGEIGFVFQVSRDSPVQVTHLGMWDDHEHDEPLRDATSPPDDSMTELPSRVGGNRQLSASHIVRLAVLGGDEILAVQVGPSKPNRTSGEFRYVKLSNPVELSPGLTYQLTQTTSKGDGDLFHNPAAYDGLSPQVHPDINVLRSIYLAGQEEAKIPTYFEAHPDYWKYRLPVRLTLMFETSR